jgi:molybdopterin-guanine dinucleotide biosynthesis protein B
MLTKKAVIQVIGYKNSGKTTTVCELIKRFSQLGYKVASIKHDAHHFEVDYPGKDTWMHREAGASVVAITSQEKFAIMVQQPIRLTDLIERIQDVDLVIVEGYKHNDYPKIVILKEEKDLSLLQETNHILAILTWFPYEHSNIPTFTKDDYPSLFEFIQQEFFF